MSFFSPQRMNMYSRSTSLSLKHVWKPSLECCSLSLQFVVAWISNQHRPVKKLFLIIQRTRYEFTSTRKIINYKKILKWGTRTRLRTRVPRLFYFLYCCSHIVIQLANDALKEIFYFHHEIFQGRFSNGIYRILVDVRCNKPSIRLEQG